MTRLARATALLAAICLVPALNRAQPASDVSLQDAALAWDEGDYIAALTTYQQLLAGADATRVLEAVALQTGELYSTREITPDGTLPQISADGKYVSYETGVAPRRLTRVVATAALDAPIVELQGFDAAFSRDGSRIAYLKVTPSPALKGAYAAVEQLPEPERPLRTAPLTTQLRREALLVVRDIATGRETTLDSGSLAKSALTFGAGNVLLFAGDAGNGTPQQVYVAAEGKAAVPLTTGPGDKAPALINATGDALLVTTRGGAVGGAAAGRGGMYGVLAIPDGRMTPLNAAGRPSFSADGASLSFVVRDGDAYKLLVASSSDPARSTIVRSGPERMEASALSRDGARVAYQLMTNDDWEIYISNRDGHRETRLTREIQHDVLPQFLGDGRLLSVIGEARHRRSYLYDIPTGQRTRLFHNNTVRTIAPEYSWAASSDGTRIVISAERDGNTVSAERGVYLMDLTRKVTAPELRARVETQLAAEKELRAKGQRLYGPIAADVQSVVNEASVSRVYGYQKALFDFDSKHITRPGNRLASAFLMDTYKSFGYQPELQWFEQRTALDGRTANVLATLWGTVNPELVYVVSSHYDSVAIGPGADDDSSGTAALLEAARLLARHPQPATIVFASFTGEESGLLGSREFVRTAVAGKVQIVGALNNDMIGWANDHRLDNTIRYSNPGIRDVQHAAAIQFTNLITYDAVYYKSTDAAAYYEAYGDIVGGIGSYPVLGNPHYHQPHDFLDTINHQLVTEVAKTTAATLMLLASSPSRLAELKVNSFSGGTATLSWRPALETGVSGYVVTYGPPDRPEAQQTKTVKPSVTLANINPGTVVSVKAVNAKGMESWDAARLVLR